MEAQAPVAPLLLTTIVGGLAALGLGVLLAIIFHGSNTSRQSRRPVTTRRRPTTKVVSDPDIVRRMLIDNADAFSNRPLMPFHDDFSGTQSIIDVPYSPTWRALRGNLTAGVFHPTHLGLLVPLQQQAVEALVTSLLMVSNNSNGEAAVDVVLRDHLNPVVFSLVVRLCFGDGVVDERDVRAMEREVWQFIFSFVEDSDLFATGSLATRLLHWTRWRRYSGLYGRLSKLIFRAVVTARQRSSPRRRGGSAGIRSYIDSLLDLRVPDNDDDATTTTGSSKRPLTDKEIMGLVFEFLGAGAETVMSTVEWTLAHLVTNPTVQEMLHHEITTARRGELVSEGRLRSLPYLRAVVLESLRLHPPVPIRRDVAAHDMAAVCGGAGSAPPAMTTADGTAPLRLIVINAGDIGRNKKVWTHSDEFRPERFLAGGEAEGIGAVPGPKEIRMLPFGAGRRYCPGAELGMVHVGYFVAALVREFDWAQPVHSPSNDLMENSNFIVMMKTPLKARITPRAPTV